MDFNTVGIGSEMKIDCNELNDNLLAKTWSDPSEYGDDDFLSQGALRISCPPLPSHRKNDFYLGFST